MHGIDGGWLDKLRRSLPPTLLSSCTNCRSVTTRTFRQRSNTPSSAVSGTRHGNPLSEVRWIRHLECSVLSRKKLDWFVKYSFRAFFSS